MRQEHAYTRFFTSLLLLLLIQPLVEPLVAGEGLTLGGAARAVLMTGIIVAGMLASCSKPRHVIIGLTLAALTLVASWVLPILDSMEEPWTESDIGLILAACPALFFFYTAGLTLQFVLRGTRVTLERIFAALCVYLLIGFAFSLIYTLINAIDTSGAFRIPEESYGPNGPEVYWRDFIFFSFVTMTTLGYGDFVPVNAWARSMTILQTIFAVFFLAVLIARLVGSYAQQDVVQDPDP